jgi:hypothetical protein
MSDALQDNNPQSPTPPVAREYHSGPLPPAPADVEADVQNSVWFGYIGLLIILSSMFLGLLSVAFAVLYLLHNAFSQ